MVNFIKDEYKDIPFRFWLAKQLNMTLDNHWYFKDYLKYSRVYNKWLANRKRKDVIYYASIQKKNKMKKKLSFLLFLLAIILFSMDFQYKNWVCPILFFSFVCSVLFLNDKKHDKICRKIESKYPFIDDLSNKILYSELGFLNKYLVKQYFDFKNNNDLVIRDAIIVVALNVMSYYYCKKTFLKMPNFVFSNSKIDLDNLNKVLIIIYQNKKYHNIVIQIEKWVKGIENIHQNGFIYVVEEDDEIYKIIDIISKITLIDKLTKRAEAEEHQEYLNEVKIFKKISKNQSQFIKENEYKIKSFSFLNDIIKEDLDNLSEEDIENQFAKIIQNIRDETQMLTTYNEKLFKNIQNNLKKQ